MKRKHRDAWCARLRDPHSRQAHGFLHEYMDEDGKPTASCCLGHFQLAIEEKFGIPIQQDEELLQDDDVEPLGLSHRRQEILAFLNDGSRVLLDEGGGITHIEDLAVTRLNEEAREWSLPEIADWIEANIPITD